MSSQSRSPRARRATHSASAGKDQLRARNRKSRMDLAIRDAFARLECRGDPVMFDALLRHVRERSSLLGNYRWSKRGFPEVHALCHLARHAAEFRRGPATWPGHDGAPQEVIASLAQHLLGDYPVPLFLASVWFDESYSLDALRAQRWFIRHARGERFRDFDLPVPMTRRMEHHFLASPDHLDVNAALRRAEVLALGGTKNLAHTICATQLGQDLSEHVFWQSVLRFFIKERERLELDEVGPIVDYIRALRFGRTEDDEPVEPEFSIAGRTLASMRRRVALWHKVLAKEKPKFKRWAPGEFQGAVFADTPGEDGPVSWQVVELLNSCVVQNEGRRMHHCVSIYVPGCVRGEIQLFSLRRCTATRMHSMLTIEVDLARRQVVQARGFRNRMAWGEPMHWLTRWAEKEGLQVKLVY